MTKQQFFNSITVNIKADEEFFKKVYGYSFYDAPFLGQVAEQLCSTNRKDVIMAYNNWFQQYQQKRDVELKVVSKDVIKNLNDWYEREVKKWRKERYSKKLRKQTEKLQLLKEKKELLEQLQQSKME